MSLTAREIEQVAAELQPLCGAFVQKVYLPEPRTAIFELRQPGASHLLLLCAEPGRTRLHRATERPHSPETPFPFQGLLRADLIGTFIESLEHAPGERMVRIRFQSPERTRTLVAELTGRHGNLFLLDVEGQIRGSAVPNLSKLRENRTGRPYVSPFKREHPPEDDAQSRFEAGGDPFGVSAAVERAYAGRDRSEHAGERRRALVQTLRTRRDRLARTVEKVRGDVERASHADEHQRVGELLKANLGKVRRGMKEVELTSWTERGPEPVRVRLDPARTPKENLERAFHQYRRLVAGQARAAARLALLQAELAEIEAKLAAAQATTDDELLAAPEPKASPAPPSPRRRGDPRAAKPYREYLSSSGQRIRVGRGAAQNDALTFRYSKGNDVWLHARGIPGAHVVVPLGRDEQLKDETLRDAALLAARHSDARGADVVEVAWTRVKHVRKVKGAAGAVTYSQEKSMHVRPDPERVASLVEPEE